MKRSVFLLSLIFLSGAGGVLYAAPKAPKQAQAPAPTTQEAAPPLSFREQAVEGFKKLYERGVGEKLYLMTDKPYYAAGDSVWFKGFLVNGVTLKPDRATNYIYVELIDGLGALRQRVKIKADSCGFHNAISLPPDLPEGDYALRAYTLWMENEDPGFFFTRRFRVANPIDDQVIPTITYANNNDGKVQATLRMVDYNSGPLKHLILTCTRNTDGHERPFNIRTDENGVAHFEFPVPPDSVRGSLHIATLKDDKVQFDRTFRLPVFSTDFDIQFFPEGGHLLAGFMQHVACKAIGANGLGVDVSGKVFNMEGGSVAEFSSRHFGMGMFNLLPAPGGRYYAEVTSKAGVTKRFDLPAPEASGCDLNVTRQGNRLLCQVIATPDIDPGRLGIVVHSKGRLLFAEEFQPDLLVKAINTDQVPEGILTITVIDRQTGAPLSERLCFVWHGWQAQGAVSPDKAAYGRRERVTLSVHVTDSEGRPAAGTFAMSVTDGKVVQLDSLENNIISALLLTQDIKGYVEEPGYYFLDRTPKRMADLDLLMMTQGWRRFDISEVLKGELKPYSYWQESEQTISGEIKGFFGNMAKNVRLVMLIPKQNYFEVIPLPRDGSRFRLRGFDFPDSTLFIFRAQKNGGGTGSNTLRLNMKKDTFPKTKVFLPRPLLSNPPPALPETFVNQAKEQYLAHGGMTLINLHAVTIAAQRVQHPLPMAMAMADIYYSLSPERLAQMGTTMLPSVLMRLPGLHYALPPPTEDNPFPALTLVKGNNKPIIFYVGSFRYDFDELPSVTAEEIASIDMYEDTYSGSYMVHITLKDEAPFSTSLAEARMQPLGYKPAVTFYQPKYEVESVRNSTTPDLRTTIYWTPDIRTDSTGTAKVSFFTADKAVPYNVVLEGVTDNGELCRTVTALERKGE